jgi:hypothetical protein
LGNQPNHKVRSEDQWRLEDSLDQMNRVFASIYLLLAKFLASTSPDFSLLVFCYELVSASIHRVFDEILVS